MQTNKSIEHVFVLMLENHAFDTMLGMSGIPGIQPPAGYYNEYQGKKYPVATPAPTTMTTDPGHEVPDVLEQLTNTPPDQQPKPIGPYPRDKFPRNFADGTGFVTNYVTNNDEDNPEPPDPSRYDDIMKCFGRKQLPVLQTLAEEFAVCTRWHASIPGPTWPNRFFVHCASSAGFDASPGKLQLFRWALPPGFKAPKGSIFQKMKAKGLRYRIYYDCEKDGFYSCFSDDPDKSKGAEGLGWIPQVATLHGIHYDSYYELKHYFEADLNKDYPYQYTFIEPHYGDLSNNTYRGGSSQHPMDDVYGGEALLKFVYETLRNSPLWEKSLLIVTYDEHGGFYDSVPPPPGVKPGDGSRKYGQRCTLNQFGFEFDQLGVRVPAVIVSPLIPRNTVDNQHVYDHSSVPATLEKLFDLDPLTERDKHANNVLPLLTLDAPRTDCPARLPDPAPSAPLPKAQLSAEEQALHDRKPLPTSGNLIGAYSILLKTHLELSPRFFLHWLFLLWRLWRIRTHGHLKAYARVVAEKHARARKKG